MKQKWHGKMKMTPRVRKYKSGLYFGPAIYIWPCHFFWCRESILSDHHDRSKSYPFSLKFCKENHSMYYYVLIFVRYRMIRCGICQLTTVKFLFEKLASEKKKI